MLELPVCVYDYMLVRACAVLVHARVPACLHVCQCAAGAQMPAVARVRGNTRTRTRRRPPNGVSVISCRVARAAERAHQARVGTQH